MHGDLELASEGDDLKPHHWVGAALVPLGRGDTRRAEHAARTGRHTLTQRTRFEVLEVYCVECRVPYSERTAGSACQRVAVRRAG